MSAHRSSFIPSPLRPVSLSSNHRWTSFQAHFILRLAYYKQDNRIRHACQSVWLDPLFPPAAPLLRMPATHHPATTPRRKCHYVQNQEAHTRGGSHGTARESL